MLKVLCSKCEYSWNYKGNKLYACCPNCQRKVAVHPKPHKSKFQRFMGV